MGEESERSPALSLIERRATFSNTEDRIAIDPSVWDGKPCIKGTRITVCDLLEYLAGGMSEEQILSDFPSLVREDVRATLVFAALRERRLINDPRD